ncbi:MAG: FAD-dependent monooxygenase [Proteobacteria bacterium]|nr:FAD-dependent monooxygenase [Pseudomonadota bacterium]
MVGKTVLIAGGGPVGLFCALILGRRGVNVRLFDLNDELQLDPRAATTHPATLEVLAKEDLVDEMRQVGLVAPIFQFWDRVSQELVAEFDHTVLSQDTPFPYVIQCEQFKTTAILLRRINALANVEINFGHEVLGVAQNAENVSITVRADGTEKSISGDYLIGADGGRSVVRKSCGIEFAGFTYPERFLVITTPFDFEEHRGYCPRSYFADPDEWCNCFKVAGEGPPGLWRAVFPADPNIDPSIILSDIAVQSRLQKFFPSQKPYEVVHRNIYTTHQRVATTFRHGRVMLAGDAAHVNNSIGGMGLNGGLQDAANLSEKLFAVLNGEPDELLSLYSLQRRTVSIEFVQAQTIANKKRLETKDPEERKLMFQSLKSDASDPSAARAFLMKTSMLAMQQRASAITLDEVA